MMGLPPFPSGGVGQTEKGATVQDNAAVFGVVKILSGSTWRVRKRKYQIFIQPLLRIVVTIAYFSPISDNSHRLDGHAIALCWASPRGAYLGQGSHCGKNDEADNEYEANRYERAEQASEIALRGLSV
ncbi:hypothetical protein FDECE_6659 [Fusarium decemcellulare]|nr:hypothetical protein FDECE_6659 [Fusarium decemcellulare]